MISGICKLSNCYNSYNYVFYINLHQGCALRAQWPLAPNFCSWATGKFQIFHTNHMLRTLQFSLEQSLAPQTATPPQWPLFLSQRTVQTSRLTFFKPLYDGHLSTMATTTEPCPQLPKINLSTMASFFSD